MHDTCSCLDGNDDVFGGQDALKIGSRVGFSQISVRLALLSLCSNSALAIDS